MPRITKEIKGKCLADGKLNDHSYIYISGLVCDLFARTLKAVIDMFRLLKSCYFNKMDTVNFVTALQKYLKTFQICMMRHVLQFWRKTYQFFAFSEDVNKNERRPRS